MRARALCTFVLLLLGTALAQADLWTVQTAAYQDYRQASSQIDELLNLGFDAYSEFAMSGGNQYARVRIGCFTTRAAAEAFASDMRGNVTADAVAQPLSVGAAVEKCVEWDVGFLKPQVWDTVRRVPDVLFRVELGGQAGYLQHAGSGWRFAHSPPVPVDPASRDSSRFSEVRFGGINLVQARLDNGEQLNACTGDLLWQSGLTAVVERSDSVIACVVDEFPHGGSP